MAVGAGRDAAGPRWRAGRGWCARLHRVQVRERRLAQAELDRGDAQRPDVGCRVVARLSDHLREGRAEPSRAGAERERGGSTQNRVRAVGAGGSGDGCDGWGCLHCGCYCGCASRGSRGGRCGALHLWRHPEWRAHKCVALGHGLRELPRHAKVGQLHAARLAHQQVGRCDFWELICFVILFFWSGSGGRRRRRARGRAWSERRGWRQVSSARRLERASASAAANRRTPSKSEQAEENKTKE